MCRVLVWGHGIKNEVFHRLASGKSGGLTDCRC